MTYPRPSSHNPNNHDKDHGHVHSHADSLGQNIAHDSDRNHSLSARQQAPTGKLRPDFKMDDERVRSLIWSFRLKATSGRIAVIRALSRHSEPLSVTDIHAKAGSTIVDDATVYRILETLAKAGLVNRIDLKNGRASYELAFGRPHHHHAVCTNCGIIEDISSCNRRELEESAQRQVKRFSEISSHSLEFFGLCKACV